jgi:AsmA protein
MKILKRLILGSVFLMLALFIVVAIFISTLDLNAYKEDIQKLTKEQTGRDLLIDGELNASFFPWIGISIGKISLSNAKGFGDQPFARMDAAKVKVEVLPLLRKKINVSSVELDGLTLDLQRALDGTTNWDDLMQASASMSTTQDNETTEVEGGGPAIAALAVGGVSISNANISWLDKQGAADAQLANFNLQTGAIELAKPFSLKTGFDLVSSSFAVNARMDAEGEATVDLERQRYLLSEFKLSASADGEGVPINNAALSLGGDIVADLGAQQLTIEKLFFDALGIKLQGQLKVASLETDPKITAKLASSEPFSLRELFKKLDIEEPVTSDPTAMSAVSLSLDLEATSQAASLNNLTIKLDDTTFSGKASLPNLAGDLPPVRFSFNVDEIDVDRYLPEPAKEGELETVKTPTKSASSAEDTPIDLPLDLIRKLDVEGEFSVDKIKVSELSASNIVIPLKAKSGVVSLNGIKASMYDGKFNSAVSLNASSNKPVYAVKAKLEGIESEPLLADLLQDKAPLSGKGNFSADITTAGVSVNGLKAKLNGGYSLSFVDGALVGINIGHKLRKARAMIKGKKIKQEDQNKKTDFSALSMSGVFTNGVLFSDDLDVRAPVLRLGGKGSVDLNKEYVDYKLRTLLTDTAKGQGGKDKSDLGGLKLSVPIRGHFDELSADFTSAIMQAAKDDFNEKLKGAKDKVKAQLKAKTDAAKAKLKAKENQAKAKLKVKENKAKAELKAKQQQQLDKAKDKLKGKLKGIFN